MNIKSIVLIGFILLFLCTMSVCAYQPQTKLRISSDGRNFTINDTPTYLNGVSYFAPMTIENGESYPGAPNLTDEYPSFETKVNYDLTQMQAMGYNWIRLWVSWACVLHFDDGENREVISSIFRNDLNNLNDPNDDYPVWRSEEFRRRFHYVLHLCDQKGMIVDLTLQRVNGSLNDPNSHENHKKWLEKLCQVLNNDTGYNDTAYKNVYIDVANEGDPWITLPDGRTYGYLSVSDVNEYTGICINHSVICTFSGASDKEYVFRRNWSEEDILVRTPFYWKDILSYTQCDFLALHLERNPYFISSNFDSIRSIASEMKNSQIGRKPIHCQEPLRRNYRIPEHEPYSGHRQPIKADFYRDYLNSRNGGAAGWCFHNGSDWWVGCPNSLPPHFNFCMNNYAHGSLFEQFKYYGGSQGEGTIVEDIIKNIKIEAMSGVEYRDPDFLIIKHGWPKENYDWVEQLKSVNGGYESCLVYAPKNRVITGTSNGDVILPHGVIFKKTYETGSGIADGTEVIRVGVYNSSGGLIKSRNLRKMSPGPSVVKSKYDLTFTVSDGIDVYFKIEKLINDVTIHLNEIEVDYNFHKSMITPKPTDVWHAGTQREITWEGIEDIDYVSIEISTNNGGSWSVINSWLPNTGSYTWLIPADPSILSTQCLIRLCDTNGNELARSEGVFTISSASLPNFTFTIPIGGESWQFGETHTISWVCNGSECNQNVCIYLVNESANWVASIANTIWAAVGTFSWKVGEYQWLWQDPPGPGDYRIRLATLENRNDPANSDITLGLSNIFTITGDPLPIIKDIKPLTGENLSLGSNYTMTWDNNGYHESYIWVWLLKSENGGFTWLGNIPNASGQISILCEPSSLNWVVGNYLDIGNNLRTAGAGASYKIQFVHAGTNAFLGESGVFTIASSGQPSLILTSPNGGENWTIGSTHRVTWTTNLAGTMAAVYLFKGAGETNNLGMIAYLPVETGYFDWTVGNYTDLNTNVPKTASAGTDYRLAIQCNYNGTQPTDFSDSYFTLSDVIPPSLTVTSPNGGESWGACSQHDITWSSTGAISSVKLEYSTDGGASWSVINGSVANTGSYSWAVPDTPSANCLVRVSETGGSATDTSDAPFTITPPVLSITITSPGCGDSWPAGTMQNIRWTSSCGISSVRIDFSTDNGASFTTIAGSVANSGTYALTIPDTAPPSTQCLIRVCDAADPSVCSTSCLFTIAPPPPATLTVTAPAGFATWLPGSAHGINWTYTQLSGNVAIDLYKNHIFFANIGTADVSAGHFTWSVPANQAAGSDYQVRVWQGAVEGWSAGTGNIPPVITLLGSSLANINNAINVTVNGNYAYVADDGNGVVIFNIVNPAAPQYVATYPTWSPRQICVVGRYAYVVDAGPMMLVLDVANPATPTYVGRCNLTGWGSAVFVKGNYAYVGDGPGGLQIIDITNPTAPQIVGNFNTQGLVGGVVVRGDLAYVACWNWGFQIVNVANPTAPLLVGSCAAVPASRVDVVGDFAYLATAENGLQVVSVANPAAPVLVGTLDTPGWARQTLAQGNYVYIADWGGHLQVVDVINNANPFIAASFTNNNGILGLDARGGNIYLADSWGYGLQIVRSTCPWLLPTSPGGGESWAAGSIHNLTWTSFGVVGNVTLELYKGGDFLQTIATVPAAGGAFAWPLPSTLSNGNDYRIRVAQGNLQAFSDNPFTITAYVPPSITVISPNGGESWPTGTICTITWTQTNMTGNVSIYLYKGNVFYSTIGTAAVEAGSFSWPIAAGQAPGNDYKVCISQGVVSDCSDNFFSISTAPTAVVPAGAIVPFDSAAAIPSGWTQFTSANGRYLVGAGNTYGVGTAGGGGAITVASTINGQHTGEGGWTGTGGGPWGVRVEGGPAGNHAHNISFTPTLASRQLRFVKASAPQDNFPVGALVLATQNLSGLTNVYADDNRYLVPADAPSATSSAIVSVGCSTAGAHQHTSVGGGWPDWTWSEYPCYDDGAKGDHSHTAAVALTADNIKKAYVTAWTNASAAFNLNSGMIVMWESLTLPPGWVLCNGQNGTVDLRDYFVFLGPAASQGTKSGNNTLAVADTIATYTWRHDHTAWCAWAAPTTWWRFQHTIGDFPHAHDLTNHNPAYQPPYCALVFIQKQ